LTVAFGTRSAIIGSLPVAGLPLFLGITFIDLRAIHGLYLKGEMNGKWSADDYDVEATFRASIALLAKAFSVKPSPEQG
jgi:hypothetical protein